MGSQQLSVGDICETTYPAPLSASEHSEVLVISASPFPWTSVRDADPTPGRQGRETRPEEAHGGAGGRTLPVFPLPRSHQAHRGFSPMKPTLLLSLFSF